MTEWGPHWSVLTVGNYLQDPSCYSNQINCQHHIFPSNIPLHSSRTEWTSAWHVGFVRLGAASLWHHSGLKIQNCLFQHRLKRGAIRSKIWTFLSPACSLATWTCVLLLHSAGYGNLHNGGLKEMALHSNGSDPEHLDMINTVTRADVYLKSFRVHRVEKDELRRFGSIFTFWLLLCVHRSKKRLDSKGTSFKCCKTIFHQIPSQNATHSFARCSALCCCHFSSQNTYSVTGTSAELMCPLLHPFITTWKHFADTLLLFTLPLSFLLAVTPNALLFHRSCRASSVFFIFYFFLIMSKSAKYTFL